VCEVDGFLARNWFWFRVEGKGRTGGEEAGGAWKVQVPRLCDWSVKASRDQTTTCNCNACEEKCIETGAPLLV
jgi:hypothetical protein